jgi:hypothetical protein
MTANNLIVVYAQTTKKLTYKVAAMLSWDLYLELSWARVRHHYMFLHQMVNKHLRLEVLYADWSSLISKSSQKLERDPMEKCTTSSIKIIKVIAQKAACASVHKILLLEDHFKMPNRIVLLLKLLIRERFFNKKTTMKCIQRNLFSHI